MRRSILLAVALFALPGCPRETDAPEPLMGTPCTQLDDCNGDRGCGALKLCVNGPDDTDGFCEEGASLIIPCPGEGEPVRPPGP
jgi:hypothetical protein